MQNNLSVPGSNKDISSHDSSPIIEKSKVSLKERNKENKELSPSLSTAAPTITVQPTDSKKDLKNKRNKDSTRSKHLSVKNQNVPKFYFPHGKPVSTEEKDNILKDLTQAFSRLEGGKAYKQHMTEISQVWYIVFKEV